MKETRSDLWIRVFLSPGKFPGLFLPDRFPNIRFATADQRRNLKMSRTEKTARLAKMAMLATI